MTELPPEQAGEQPDLELLAAAQQHFARREPQAWRPACAYCLNGHKLAIAELSARLIGQKVMPGSPEFAQAMNEAAAWGQQLDQNPMAAQGLNGTRPDIIPPVRPADVLVGGTTCCIICLQPMKQTSLAVAPAGWTPGLGG